MSKSSSFLGVLLVIVLLILSVMQATFILIFFLLAIMLWVLTKGLGLSLNAFKLN